jgi:tRNA (guanine37-N1)-methyltransferase
VRVDIVTIFPEFFSVLDVSLLGRARREELLELHVHDLRDHTHDRHRTVDDTPYGGGAGMVMRPEPWGEAFDELLEEGEADAVVVFPTPAGVPFTQSLARELAEERRLIFACGRYEGIDARVAEHVATRARVLEVSLGDYVLNGGEVAAMAMIEAVGRLVPGVVGNPASLVEESHEDGLLEHPSYTKPAAWRGLEVPEVLRGGNHAAIAAWRREQALERTRRVRPDLLPGGTDAEPSANNRAGRDHGR